MKAGHEIKLIFEGRAVPKIDKFESERSLLRLINDLSVSVDTISDTLKWELRGNLPEGVDVSNVEVYFFPGSVNWKVIVEILDLSGRIADNLSLVQVLVSTARFLINRTVRIELSEKYDGDKNVWDVETSLNEVIPSLTQAVSENPITRTSPQPLFSNKIILIAITLMNLLIFLGGTVYAWVTVPSLAESVRDADNQIQLIQQELTNKQEEINAILLQASARSDSIREQLSEVEDEAAHLQEQIKRIQSSTRFISFQSLLEHGTLGFWAFIAFLVVLSVVAYFFPQGH